jgi:hypothetical protein
MKTLQEDIDDLDRMVDTNAGKDAIRSQIRLIAREVEALEASNVRLNEDNAELNQALAKYKARDAAEYSEQVRRSQAVYLDRPHEAE